MILAGLNLIGVGSSSRVYVYVPQDRARHLLRECLRLAFRKGPRHVDDFELFGLVGRSQVGGAALRPRLGLYLMKPPNLGQYRTPSADFGMSSSYNLCRFTETVISWGLAPISSDSVHDESKKILLPIHYYPYGCELRAGLSQSS